MNAIGLTLSWVVIQVTVLAAMSLVVYAAARRTGPTTGSFVACVAMILMTLVTIVAIVPGWSWQLGRPLRSLAGVFWRFRGPPRGRPPTSKVPLSIRRPGVLREIPQPCAPSPVGAALSAFWSELTSPAQEKNDTLRTGWGWEVWWVAVLLIGLGVGLLRLAAGLIWVRRFRRASTPIEDSELREQWELLSAELSCVRRVELRETRSLSARRRWAGCALRVVAG